MAVSKWSAFVCLCFLFTLNGPDGVRAAITFVPGNGTVAENSPTNTSVKVLTASGGTAPYTFTLDAPSDEFFIDGDTVRVKLGAYLDYENTTSFDEDITVQDDAGDTNSETLTVYVTDVVETNPTIYDGFSCATNLLGEGGVINTFEAQDTDEGPAGVIASYAITAGNDGATFTNDGAMIKVAAGKSLNMTNQRLYVLTFLATDGGTPPGTASASIAIGVADTCDGVQRVGATIFPLVTAAVMVIVSRYI